MRGRSLIPALAAALVLPLVPAAAHAAAWLPATDASERGFAAADVTADIGEDGSRLVAWVRTFRVGNSDRHGVQYRYIASDGTRREIRTASGIPTLASPSEREPKVGVRPDGSALLVWTRDSGGDERVHMQRIDSKGDPDGPPTTISPTGADANEIDIDVGPDGSALAAWTTWDGTRASVDGVRVSAAGVVGPVEHLIEAPAETADESWQFESGPEVALAPDGRGVVTASLFHFVFNPCCTGTRDVLAVRVGADGTPSSTVHSVTGGEVPNFGFVEPRAAIDDAGNATIVYSDDDGTDRTVNARRLSAGDTLGPRRTLNDPAATSAHSPAVAAAPDGRTYVVYEDSGGGQDDARAAVLAPDGTVAVSGVPMSSHDADFPSVAVGRDGAATAAFAEDAGDDHVVGRSISPAGALGAPQQLSGPTDEVDGLVLAAGAGDRVAAWQTEDSVSGRDVVQTAVFDATAPTVEEFAGPSTGSAGSELTWAARAADLSGVSYQWAFGDGGTAGEAIARHAYTVPGTYTVTLTVSDGAGNQVQRTRQVRVTSPDSDGDGILDGADCAPGDASRPATGGPDADCDGKVDAPSGGGNDAPPQVELRSPSGGARISPRGTTPIAADASDDRGVAAVVFYIGARELCRDSEAPYTCDLRPTGADVGRTAITAIAVDSANQTASTRVAVSVGRFTPSLTSKTKRGRVAVTSGRVGLPDGVQRADGCRGRVAITYRSGGWTRTVTAALRRNCTYKGPRVRRRGRRAVTVTAVFAGNDVLSDRAARRQRVR